MARLRILTDFTNQGWSVWKRSRNEPVGVKLLFAFVEPEAWPVLVGQASGFFVTFLFRLNALCGLKNLQGSERKYG